MKKIVNKIMFVIIFIVVAIPIEVKAETAPDFNKKPSLTVELCYMDTKLSGEIAVYQVADMIKTNSSGVTFQVLKEYQTIHQNLDNKTADKQIKYASDFLEHIDDSTLIAEVKSDASGYCSLENEQLTPGMYLIIPKNIKNYCIDPFLVAVPRYFSENDTIQWQYDVVCQPKSGRVSDSFEPSFRNLSEREPYLPKNKEEISNKKSKLPQTGTVKLYNNQLGIGFLAIMTVCIKLRKKN